MRNDTVGILCREDRTILIYGYWSLRKSKEKIVGKRDIVRKEMRYLGHCFKYFLQSEQKK